MTDILSKKLESKLDDKLISKSKRKHLEDGFKKGKVINEVLDKPTVMTLYKMITDHIIAYVNGSVSAGKESVLFWAVDDNEKNVALKIYLVSTSNFKKREPYILGDPRFSNVKKGTKNLVYLWAKKEFRNLTQCYD
ncbi:MAG: serine protein kinase RIO, partial [Nitrosopumilus sp.]|nr:serine protein kinase RIO [Nitrosopumilus sp.]